MHNSIFSFYHFSQTILVNQMKEEREFRHSGSCAYWCTITDGKETCIFKNKKTSCRPITSLLACNHSGAHEACLHGDSVLPFGFNSVEDVTRNPKYKDIYIVFYRGRTSVRSCWKWSYIPGCFAKETSLAGVEMQRMSPFLPSPLWTSQCVREWACL